MTTPTKLLIRWQHGYTTVGAGSKLGYLTLGSMSQAEAEKVGTKELARLAAAGEQISLGADPNPGHADDAVFTGWDLGDYVYAPTRADHRITALDADGYADPDGTGKLTATGGAVARVMQISIGEDVDGNIDVLPELSSLVDERAVRIQRSLKRMVDGTLDGSSAVAQPIVTPEYVPARRPGSTTQTFSWNPQSLTRSSPWTPEVNGRFAQVHLKRAGSTVGEVHVALILNGVTIDEAIIWDGDEEGIFGGTGVQFGPEDKLELEPTEINGDNLTARAIQTHYH